MIKVFVAGDKGMVGSAIVRELAKSSDIEILTRDRSELDLRDQKAVGSFFETNSVDQVYLAAAKVGGIYANSTYPAEFIYDNLMIQTNVIYSARESGVRKLLYLGSSCIYPRIPEIPIREEQLLEGQLESTNRPYAIAKIAGLEMCSSYARQYGVDYRSVMPTNLYGPGDSYHPELSHVIPGLIYKFHEAMVHKRVSVALWGTGSPLREFLHVDDLARAACFVMNLDRKTWVRTLGGDIGHLNVGSGQEISINELADVIARVVGFGGEILWDETKPDGTPRKLLDSSRLQSLGWSPSIDLGLGLRSVYSSYLEMNQ